MLLQVFRTLFEDLKEEGHGAMSGTNFKKNQKSKTPYLVHYKLCHLKGWLSSMERFDLDCYYIDEVSSSITTGCIFFFQKYIHSDFFLLFYSSPQKVTEHLGSGTMAQWISILFGGWQDKIKHSISPNFHNIWKNSDWEIPL